MFFLNVDLGELQDLLGLEDAVKEEMKLAGQALTAAMHAHIEEEANKKLHTRRAMFLEGVEIMNPDPDVWVVSLDASVRWIDDGLPEHSMVDDLLKSDKAKTAKDGSKYLSVPFQHNKGPTQLTPSQQTLLDTIKRNLKSFGVPYGKIETDNQGNAKLGKLHEFDIMTAPIKTNEGPGQGKGPIGAVRQGPTGIPLLQGVQVIQKKVTRADGSEGVGRFIMTFRTVSSKHKEENRWMHPGLPGIGVFDETAEWAKQHWETVIAPKLISDVLIRLS